MTPSAASPPIAGVAVAYVNAYVYVTQEIALTTLTASEARASLYRLIDEAAESHKPILISGKRHDAVLVSAEDWAAIQETLFLLAVPGMRESIHAGMAEVIDECAEEPGW